MAIDSIYDMVKSKDGLATDRVAALRQVIVACRKSGRVSIPGVYAGVADKYSLGALMEKGLTIKSGQTHGQKLTKVVLKPN